MLALLVRGPCFKKHCLGPILPLEIPSLAFSIKADHSLSSCHSPVSCFTDSATPPPASLPYYDIMGCHWKAVTLNHGFGPIPKVLPEQTSWRHISLPSSQTRKADENKWVTDETFSIWVTLLNMESWGFSTSYNFLRFIFWWPGKAKRNTQPKNL